MNNQISSSIFVIGITKSLLKIVFVISPFEVNCRVCLNLFFEFFFSTTSLGLHKLKYINTENFPTLQVKTQKGGTQTALQVKDPKARNANGTNTHARETETR